MGSYERVFGLMMMMMIAMVLIIYHSLVYICVTLNAMTESILLIFHSLNAHIHKVDASFISYVCDRRVNGLLVSVSF